MKKTAFLAAIAVALFATPAAATGGSIGGAYGASDLDGTDAETWQIDGAFGGQFGNNWGFQLDGGFGNTDFDGGGDADHYSLGGHLFYQGSGWRLGGLIGTSNIDGGGADIDEHVYGVAGTLDMGANTVLVGTATVGEVDFFGVDLDTWNIDAGVRFYPSSNLRLSGAIGIGNVDTPGNDFDTLSAGLAGEWAPFAAPVSFTLGYNHFSDDSAVFDGADTVSLGVRWNFGGGTLRDRDNATPFDTHYGGLYPRGLDLR